MQKVELRALAEVGALNFLSEECRVHRRNALWQVERALRRPGPLLEKVNNDGDANIPIASGMKQGTELSELAESPLFADDHGRKIGRGLSWHRTNCRAAPPRIP